MPKRRVAPQARCGASEENMMTESGSSSIFHRDHTRHREGLKWALVETGKPSRKNELEVGMAAAALQRGSWGLRLRIADIKSICASKFTSNLDVVKKCICLHILTSQHESQFVLRLVFDLAYVVLSFSLPLTTAIAP